MSTLVKIWLSLLLLAIGAYGAYTLVKLSTRVESTSDVSHVSAQNAAPISSVTWDDLAKITLTERSGKPFPLADMQGKTWILSFFFASCPGSCRIINSNLAGLQKHFAAEGQDVTIVSISVDPENDTPAVLTQYAQSFGADEKRWVFLTGDFPTIGALASDLFKIPAAPKFHHDRVVLIAPDGNVEKTYNTSRAEDVILLKRKVAELAAAGAKS